MAKVRIKLDNLISYWPQVIFYFFSISVFLVLLYVAVFVFRHFSVLLRGKADLTSCHNVVSIYALLKSILFWYSPSRPTREPTPDCSDRAFICRAVKRAGPSKKVWCSRLGPTKTSRLRLLTLELRFLKKFYETPFYMQKLKEGFWCIFVLRHAMGKGEFFRLPDFRTSYFAL